MADSSRPTDSPDEGARGALGRAAQRLRSLLGKGSGEPSTGRDPAGLFKRQRDQARRQRDRHAATLDALREGDLAFFSRELVAGAECPTCAAPWAHLCTYPYSTSPLFSRLVVLWCSSCGLGWVPEVPFDLGDYYAEEYAKSNRKDRDVPPEIYFTDANPLLGGKTGRRYFRRAKAQVGRIRERLGEIDTMLDFGSGPGYALHASGARVKHAVEADPSCSKYLAHLGAERLTLEELGEEVYDVVLSSHSLEHLMADDLLDTLRRLRRALKPDGLLYIEVPSAGLTRYRMVYKHEPHTLFFSMTALREAVAKAGFDIDEARPFGKKDSPMLAEPLFEPPGGDGDGHLSRGALTVIARRGTAPLQSVDSDGAGATVAAPVDPGRA